MPLTTGFIGLGAMGAHMARNLHQRSLLTTVWNRSPAKAEAFSAELGAHCASSIADLA
jgi:3-hydroxyisobutyrate dehydrogenase